MINKLFNKLGYSKTSWLLTAQDRANTQRQKTKEWLAEYTETKQKLNTLTKKHDTLKKEAQTLRGNNLDTRKLQNWAKKVKKHKICDICEVTDVPMNAHHLWAKSQHPSLAYNVVNGVCICTECHNKYHDKYPHIEDCNPYTYNEFKIDEQNKARLEILETEVQNLKSKQGKFSSFMNRFKQGLSEVTV